MNARKMISLALVVQVTTLATAYNPPYQDLGVLCFVVDTSYTAFLPSVRRDWTSR
jgi:hypothetical protein